MRTVGVGGDPSQLGLVHLICDADNEEFDPLVLDELRLPIHLVLLHVSLAVRDEDGHILRDRHVRQTCETDT